MWEGVPLKDWKFEFSSSVGYHAQSHFPPLIIDHILEENVALIAFRQILPKILSAAYIFSIIMTNLKKLTGNKSINTKQCPAGLSPRITALNFYGKPCGWERISANSQKIINFLHQNKFASSSIKSFIPSSSNGNFHLITLYKIHL